MRSAKVYHLLAAIGLSGGLLLTAIAWGAEGGKAPKGDDNPYAPRKGLSPQELHAFIEHLQDSPASLHERPGFGEGMLDAADQLLASKPDAAVLRFALLAKFAALHQLAVNDAKDGDKNLAAFAKAMRDDKDAEIAKQAKFYLLEQKVIAADDLKPEKLAKLLAEAKTALTGETLDGQHLRIASAIVHIINRLPDDELAARSYKEFGELFAKSDDDELSAYGRKIAATEPPETIIGKPLLITGRTLEGLRFDIAKYRGRVVLVSFWSTESGPCRDELPELIKLHKQFHAKGFEIVGVDLDKNVDDVGKFLDHMKLPWINLIGERNGDELIFPLAEKYDITAIPSTFLVGRDGRVIVRNPSDEELSKKLEELLKSNPPPAAVKPAETRKKAPEPAKKLDAETKPSK